MGRIAGALAAAGLAAAAATLVPDPAVTPLAAAGAAAVAVAALPRIGWIACATALAVLLATDLPGAAVVVLCGAPVVVLIRGSGHAWSLPAVAPLLGLAGLAGAYPALAGRAGLWWQRAGLGAAGLWWLLLAEPLLGETLLSGAGVPRGWRGTPGFARRRRARPLDLGACRARSGLGGRRAAAAVAGARPLRRMDFVAASTWAAAWAWAPPRWPSGPGAGSRGAGRGGRRGRPGLAAAPPAPAGYRERPAMSVLRNLESKLAGLVEGTFSRAFKSEVRPVEIARKLTREMEENKVQSLSRTYAPNEYAVWLSPDDRNQFEGYERDLATELSGYLLEHARRERIALVTSPKISLKTDDRLRLGEFGIQARLVRPGDDDCRRRARATRATRWSTRRPTGSPRSCASPTTGAGKARLRYEGKTAVLPTGGGVIGRSRDCDVVLSDQNVSASMQRCGPAG